MLFDEDREAMNSPVLVESKNTGKHWRMSRDQVRRFFTGRKREWYRVFEVAA